MGIAISALDPLDAADLSQSDEVPIVDVDDGTQSPAGTTKRITVADLLSDLDAANVSGNLDLGSGTIAAGTATFGTTTLGNTTVGGHLASTGTAPTVAAGAGAGTSPTIAMATGSTDTFGAVNLTYGTSVPGSGAIFTVTYATAFTGTAPFPVVCPISAGAQVAGIFVSTYNLSGFTVYSAGGSLGSASIVNVSYHVGH